MVEQHLAPMGFDAEDGSLIVYLKSPPVDGKANQELIALLAKEFKVTKTVPFPIIPLFPIIPPHEDPPVVVIFVPRSLVDVK